MGKIVEKLTRKLGRAPTSEEIEEAKRQLGAEAAQNAGGANGFTAKHLSLYRQLLRAHAQKLPAAARELGDGYVKAEFRSHRDAAPKFLAAFEAQWREYLAVLRTQPDGDLPGRDLTADELGGMSDEQKVQVVEIYEKSRGSGPG